MKEEIIRKLDELGRIVIPFDYINKLGWTKCSEISISMNGNQIILQLSENKCDFCGTGEDLILFKEKYICKKCADEIKII